MACVTVLGAGVVGSTYGALLAVAGHDVTLVARGARAEQLLDHGLAVMVDGTCLSPAVRVAPSVDKAAPEVLLVAVRGDQLPAALEEIAACPAPFVWMFTSPLDLRAIVEERIGRERLVWCFSGVGGALTDGLVTAHRVAQQPTVVEQGATGSDHALEVLAQIDPKARAECDMAGWLDTHTVFVAAMAALILGQPLRTPRQRLRGAAQLVRAMRQGFNALEDRGTRVTPANLRAIFGKVPLLFAALYWAVQLNRPVVQVSMLPHAKATRMTEQRAVAAHALDLVGDGTPRYRTLLGALVTSE